MRKSKARGITWVWLHLFLTFALLMVGIGIKLLVYQLGQPDDYQDKKAIRVYGEILGVSTVVTSVLITTVRMLHKV